MVTFSSLRCGRRLQPVQHVLRQWQAAQQRQVPGAVHHMLVCWLKCQPVPGVIVLTQCAVQWHKAIARQPFGQHAAPGCQCGGHRKAVHACGQGQGSAGVGMAAQRTWLVRLVWSVGGAARSRGAGQ